ncbi:methyltransferase domain-containing protein [Aestuariispira ectoiniformans]|uniref:methyltransferase domain-containing protein n=1 Tax=Aestuariispira ectoiniformans TaxID=2775080 RepID=UPI00223C1EDA|nr:class I SAM-dependent methyltransferase [Aestuariispira ectoiniformans]
MPGSSQFGKLYTTLLLKKLYDLGMIRRVMDVGVGSGTYHNLLAEHLPDADWIGVEVWEPYIERFDLRSLYGTLYNEDVRTLDFDEIGKLDLTLYGDILEHMTKEEAQAVMEKTLAASRLVLLSIPIVHYPQDEVEGNPYEVHVKDDWSHQEVCTSFPNVLTAFVHDHIGVYCLSADEEMARAVVQIHPVLSQMVEKNLPDDRIKWG